MNWINLQELCKDLSISDATGRNWIKGGRLTPQRMEGSMPLFSVEYVAQLKQDLQRQEEPALKSRRNKKYIAGNGMYRSYLSSDSENISVVEYLVKEIESAQIPVNVDNLCFLLAECGLQLLLQRERIETVPGKSCLKAYVEGAFAHMPFFWLVDSLLDGKKQVLDFIDTYPQLFTVSYVYREREDCLGFLYMSCKNIRSRKAEGAYYTPAKVGKKLVERLLSGQENLEEKTILDPCCGTGNFLLQLPEKCKINHIYGNDSDAISVLLTRMNLALTYRVYEKEILQKNVTCADFLVDYKEPPVDFIVGNPPWGYEFSGEEKSFLGSKYKTAGGNQVESYDLFIEKALMQLKKHGMVSFVLPEAVLYVKAHRKVRQLMEEESTIRYLSYLGNVFHKVQCPSVILQLEYTGEPMQNRGMEVEDGGRRYIIKKKRQKGIEDLCFHALDEEYQLLEKIAHQVNTDTLKGKANFAMGIVTGNNQAFVSDTPSVAREPVRKGTDIFKYHARESTSYITFSPKQFQQMAPVDNYRAEEKLLYRFICNQLVFAYDNSRELTLNSCNILIPDTKEWDIKYILAILNSSVSQFYFQKRFRTMKVLRTHIENIPIPVIAEEEQQYFIQMADKLMTEASMEKRCMLFKEIDKKIARLYGLDEKEYQMVLKGVDQPFRFLEM